MHSEGAPYQKTANGSDITSPLSKFLVSTGMPLLPLRRVPGLGGLLGGAPPGLVVAVPRDGLGQAGGEVGVPGPPAELAAELGGVDGVAAVVAGP